MIKQFLLQILRSISRQKLTFLINSSGLVIGITAVILVTVLITDELKFDNFHDDPELIFRVNKWYTSPGGERSKNAETPGLMAKTLVEDFPEINSATHIAPWFDEVLLTHEATNIYTDKWVFADAHFFEIFNFKIYGNQDPKTLISKPGQVLITPELAAKLFGKMDPVGQVVQGVGNKYYQVTGIIESAPRQSHIQYEVIASWASTESQSGFLDFGFLNNWLGQTVITYLKLNPTSTSVSVNQKFPEFTARYMPDRIDMYDFYLQPLSEIYLHSTDIQYLRGGSYGSYRFLKVFAWIASLILIVACFNYINITTARSLQRAKEVGVKKVLGASNYQLLNQFVFETFALVIFSAAIAVVLAGVLLPLINNWFGKSIPLEQLMDPIVLIILLGGISITTLLSGIFPGFVLTRFKPVQSLKSMFGISPRGVLPRMIFTTIQLSVGIGLIATSWVFQKQYKYLIHKDLGFAKDQIVTMKTPPGIDSNYTAFLNEVNKLPGVISTSMCQAVIQQGTFGTTVIPEGYGDQEVPVRAFRVDTNYLNTFNLEIANGRFFKHISDFSEGGIVINQAFANQMNWINPVGKRIKFPGSDASSNIIGVIKDFHFSSLHEVVSPLIMYLDNRRGNISVRFNPDQANELLAQLQPLWKKFESRYPFDFQFLDDYFANSYANESHLNRIVQVFTALAIFIAFLGIIAWISFALARRKKEIGIRKILGSTGLRIMHLLAKDFILPLSISFLIAVPIVHGILQKWLHNYAYHHPLQLWIYFGAGIIMAAIVMLTISTQCLTVFYSNPIESLRDE